MNTLITGCCGFIGFNFTKKLIESNNFKIIGIDSLQSKCSKKNRDLLLNEKNFEFIEQDILNINSLDLKGIDCVVNFAAESHVDNSIFRPEKFIQSNVLGYVELLKFCNVNNIEKILHISTDEVYGSNIENFAKESDFFNPSSPYSASKASAELMANSYTKTYGMEITTVRPANNYGIFQQPEKLIPFSLANLLNNKNIELYGNGMNVRHWLHVDDTVSALMLLLNKLPSQETFNIGSDVYFTNLEVSKKILEIMHLADDRISFVKDRPAHDFRYAVNFQKLLDTGWIPKANFDDELVKIINWYSSNKEWWEDEYNQIVLKNRNKRFKLKQK